MHRFLNHHGGRARTGQLAMRLSIRCCACPCVSIGAGGFMVARKNSPSTWAVKRPLPATCKAPVSEWPALAGRLTAIMGIDQDDGVNQLGGQARSRVPRRARFASSSGADWAEVLEPGASA